jgi:hypothetical protein
MWVPEPGIAASMALLAPLESPVRAKNEGPGPSPSGIAPRHQRRQGRQGVRLVAGDREAEREPAPASSGIASEQCCAIVLLGVRMPSEQVIGEAAVAADHRLRRTALLALAKY